jgi:hypothetical protein
MALDSPQIVNVNSQFWRGGDTSDGDPYRNRPGLRVVLVVTEASRALAFGSGASAAVADKELQKSLGLPPKQRGTLRVDITNWCKSVEWGTGHDEKYVSLNITLDNSKGMFNGIPRGSMIVIERRKPIHSPRGRFYPMLSCHLWNKNRSFSGRSEEMVLELFDRMKWIAEYDVPKKVYKKDKAHKQGWTTRQILQDIARRANIPLGEISTTFNATKHTRFETTGSVFDSIQKVLKIHRTKIDKKIKDAKRGKPTKLRFIIHCRDGKLNIITLKDPATYAKELKAVPFFNDSLGIESGSVSEQMDDEKFATRLLLKASAATTKKNKKNIPRKKITQKVVVINPTDPNVQKVFGVIEKEDHTLRRQNLDLGALRKKGQEKLDKFINPETTIEFTTRGYPNLWPGDFILINSLKLGVRGLYAIDNIGYSFTAGQLLMTISVKSDSLIENTYAKFVVSGTKFDAFGNSSIYTPTGFY